MPIKESAVRDVEVAAIGQQVLVFEATTGHGIDEAFDRCQCGPRPGTSGVGVTPDTPVTSAAPPPLTRRGQGEL
jgi:hypothetical protein